MALMRRSSSGVSETEISPCPMKALRRNTGAVTPVSVWPASGPVRPGTGSAVPVTTAEKSRMGAFFAGERRRSVIGCPFRSSSISPSMGAPDQGA